jgi:hypothetical protein
LKKEDVIQSAKILTELYKVIPVINNTRFCQRFEHSVCLKCIFLDSIKYVL